MLRLHDATISVYGRLRAIFSCYVCHSVVKGFESVALSAMNEHSALFIYKVPLLANLYSCDTFAKLEPHIVEWRYHKPILDLVTPKTPLLCQFGNL